MAPRLVVVTGGAGFLGEHVARALKADGARVRLFDTAPQPAWASTADAEYVHGDVRSPQALLDATTGADAIVHAAFASPRQPSDTLRSVNVSGSANVRDAARHNRVPRVVLISSTIVSGPARRHPFWNESPLSRLDLYRTTRIEAERLIMEAPAAGGSTAIVRPQSFLGPGRLGAFGIIFELLMAGDPVPVLGDGSHRYQLLGVQDFAHGVSLLTTSPASGVFAFGAQTFSTVREDLNALIARVQSASRLRFFPSTLSRAGLKALELAGFVPLSEWHRHSAWRRDSVADTSRAETELRWKATRTNVDALAEAYGWYVDTIRSTGDAPRTHPLPRAHAALRQFIRMLPG